MQTDGFVTLDSATCRVKPSRTFFFVIFCCVTYLDPVHRSSVSIIEWESKPNFQNCIYWWETPQPELMSQYCKAAPRCHFAVPRCSKSGIAPLKELHLTEDTILLLPPNLIIGHMGYSLQSLLQAQPCQASPAASRVTYLPTVRSCCGRVLMNWLGNTSCDNSLWGCTRIGFADHWNGIFSQ